MATPSLKPIQLKEHTCKQGNYGDIVPKLPMRSMLVGPSGSGKTVLLTNMILDIYKGCFSRIYVWSPSISVCLLYTSPSPRDVEESRMPSSA